MGQNVRIAKKLNGKGALRQGWRGKDSDTSRARTPAGAVTRVADSRTGRRDDSSAERERGAAESDRHPAAGSAPKA
eukprot:4256146-Prymnesium_polylepis.1